MVDFKELQEGAVVGGYTLQKCLRQEGVGTFFAASAEDGGRVLVKLVPAQEPDAEQQFAVWRRIRHLRHTHLLELHDLGRAELSGATYLYAVFEQPDDVLATALEHGPLTEPETRSVLEAATAALQYLHAQGLVHGAVAPRHIVAVGDTIKLSTDALRESDNLEEHAEDIQQLGELVRTLRAPEPLTEPLAAVVRHATAAVARERWTRAEIAQATGPVAAATGPEAAAGTAPARRPAAAFPKWIVAGVVALLLAIVIFNMRRKAEAPQPSPRIQVPAVSQPSHEPSPTAAPAASGPAAPPLAPAAPSATAVWRVIAFTYRDREMAAKKADQINQRWPELHASVFSPSGRRGYFLVALGDRMERDEAVRLQRKARSLGLPRDTYVQNYNN